MRAPLASIALAAVLVFACSHAEVPPLEYEPSGGQAGSGQAGDSAAGNGDGGTESAGTSQGGASAGKGGAQTAGAAGTGEAGVSGSTSGGKAGTDSFGGGGESGEGGEAGDGVSFVGGAGTASGTAGTAGTAGKGGSSGTSGQSGASGSGSGAAPGWTCGASLYNSGGKWPSCDCDCGIPDPDCTDPDSYVKGCGKGQTCGSDGTCQGAVLTVPKSWTCGSAYYAIGGKSPVCDCACGAPDPDCDLPHPTYNLTKCGKGQTCGSDGTCQGPILTVPAAWTCKASKYAEGKTNGTCDCNCGAPDPDCVDQNLVVLGCGYKQTCSASGACQGEIAPAPAGWTCASNTYSDGKLCNCEGCGVRDPDCDLDDLPDDCGADAFCGSIKNECIDLAN